MTSANGVNGAEPGLKTTANQVVDSHIDGLLGEEVFPIAQLPEITLAACGSVALVTKGPTPYDGRAAVKLEGDVVAELEAVLACVSRARSA